MGLFEKKRGHRFSSEKDEIQKTLHKNLGFTAIEQYKLIRANLDFVIPETEKCPVIGVTSSMPGEGKSTTSINLSYVFAEKGHKVLLIDGDMRLPSISKKLDLEGGEYGLSDLLRNTGAPLPEFKPYLLDNWYILTMGDIPPNPSELLGSSRMEKLLNQLKDIFDYIIIDLPPVNIVSDAVSISRLLSGMIVVVREERTQKRELEICVRQLRLSNVNILGFILLGAVSGSRTYGSKNKYYHYDSKDTQG